jgi:hypothetical protein
VVGGWAYEPKASDEGSGIGKKELWQQGKRFEEFVKLGFLHDN